jgi:uncharacterized membrane protein
MTASPENLVAILVMTLAAATAKGGGFPAMRWFGHNRFVMAWLEHAPDAVLISAAVVPVTQGGGTYWLGAIAAAAPTLVAGFTAGLFTAVGAAALARWAGLG